VRRKSEPAADDEDKAMGKPKPAPKDADSDEKSTEKHRSRLAMTLREAEVIARNLKESGTRR
jgi:hypothetical protein